ncbi:MAG: ATP-binding protein [Limnochordia bacterium]|jgi:anti-sigma regulatory factor (Ser/Thr protein kinase)
MRFLQNRNAMPAEPRKDTLQAVVAHQETESDCPQVIIIEDEEPKRFLHKLISAVGSLLEDRASPIPALAAAELLTNLAHAGFQGAAVTISADGSRLTVSDHGPGIPDKERALLFGYYSKAPEQYAALLRGAGTGLPVVNHLVTSAGGEVLISDNLGGGTVVTIDMHPAAASSMRHDSAGPYDDVETGFLAAQQTGEIAPHTAGDHLPETEYSYLHITNPETVPDQQDGARSTQLNMQGPAVAEALSDLQTKLSRRQRRVLFLVADLGQVGPSTASAELAMSLSTAFRDLVVLEEMGLVQSDANGKRSLTPLGARVIAALSS